MAAMMIGHALGLPQDKIKGIKMLKEIQDLEDLYDKAASVFGTESIKSRNASSICEEIVRKSLEQGVYQVAEVGMTQICRKSNHVFRLKRFWDLALKTSSRILRMV